MVTISQPGIELDSISIKIDGKIYFLSENSDKILLFKALKELARVILLNKRAK